MLPSPRLILARCCIRIETSHLICPENQLSGSCMKSNTKLKWVGNGQMNDEQEFPNAFIITKRNLKILGIVQNSF